MGFEDFIKLPDKERIFLIEAKVAKEVQGLSWTATGSGSYWCSFSWGEVLVVSELLNSSGAVTVYSEVGSIANCDSTTSSFYYDHTNGRLYVHPSGDDSPDTSSKYTILAYICIGFSNEDVVYSREEEALLDGNLEQWYSATDLVQWYEYVSGTSTVNRESSDVYKGTYSVRLDIDASDNLAYVQASVTLTPGCKCKIVVWYKNSTTGKTAQILLKDSGDNQYLNLNGEWQVGATGILLANATVWTKFELEFSAHASYSEYVFLLANYLSSSSSVYYDDARVKMVREPMQYLPYFDAASVPALVQAVGDYYEGSIKTQFGSLVFLNDGWWYTTLEDFIWHNKEIDVKCGAKDSDYEEFGAVFAGRIRDPDIGDSKTTLKTRDRRVGTFRQLPKDKYWSSDTGYEDLEEGAEGKAKGIPFGQLADVSPVFIKTDGSTYWRFKISKYAIEEITTVYLDGEAIDSGDITKVPASGHFDLDFNPGDGHVTCDIKGVKCNFDDSTYSENIADVLWFVLNQENDFDWSRLDKVSFDDLKSARSGITIAYFLSESMSTLNFIRFLQATGVFQFVPRPDGTYGAYRYKSGTEEDTPRLYNEDYDSLKKKEETATAYRKIVLRYARNPTTGNWLTVEPTTNMEETGYKVAHRYGEEEALTIETALREETDAETLAELYQKLVRDPATKLEGTIGSVALGFKPSDKIIVSKEIIDGEENIVQVFGESPNYDEIYRILELKKNLKTGKVGILGLEDSQSIGETHSNVPHDNTHSDTHTDTAHTNTHNNAAHANSLHKNSHNNSPYEDSYTDHTDYIEP